MFDRQIHIVGIYIKCKITLCMIRKKMGMDYDYNRSRYHICSPVYKTLSHASPLSKVHKTAFSNLTRVCWLNRLEQPPFIFINLSIQIALFINLNKLFIYLTYSNEYNKYNYNSID